MSKLLALTARSESGKDFLAKHLTDNHNYVRVSFSDELKKLAHIIYPWCDLDYEPILKNVPIKHPHNVNGYSPREVWKSIDKLRDTDPLIFVRGAIANAIKFKDSGKNVIFTDVRKPVEYKSVSEFGCKVIKIVAADTPSYADEDVIDSFSVDTRFTNVKNRGYGDWVRFCQDSGIIDTPWINAIGEMIDKQVEVNNAFSPNWRCKTQEPVPSMHQWRIAISSEHNELMDELESKWVWWKPTKPIETNKALEELVDVVAFSLAHYLVQYQSDECAKSDAEDLAIQLDSEPFFIDVGCSDIERMANLSTMICGHIKVADKRPRSYLYSLCIYIMTGCKIIGVSKEEFFKMFMAKHDLNLDRHRSGYQETGDKTGLETVTGIIGNQCDVIVTDDNHIIEHDEMMHRVIFGRDAVVGDNVNPTFGGLSLMAELNRRDEHGRGSAFDGGVVMREDVGDVPIHNTTFTEDDIS